MVRPKTLFIDIDGTLIKHHGSLSDQITEPPELLPGTLEKLNQWDREGCRIILVTGRRESTRAVTERQLDSLGIFYDTLIMGLGGGKRIIVNDFKPDSTEDTAGYVCLDRNQGINGIDL